MSELWRRWARQMATREPGTPLALFRVGVGLSLLFNMILLLHADVIGILWIDASHGGLLSLRPSWLVEALGGAVPSVIWPLVYVTTLCAALVTVGLGGRAPVIIGLQTHLALYSLVHVASGGYDPLTSNALWLLFLGDANRTLSLDCRLRRGRWIDTTPIPIWPRYLAILQLVVVYGASGLHKLGATWLPSGGYSALYWSLQDATFRRFDTAWAAYVFPLTQLGTFVSWVFEVGAPLLLLVFYYRATRERPGRLRALLNRRDLRVPFALVGLSLHVGIIVMFEVGAFSPITASFYFCLWRHEELARAGRWLRRRAGRG